MRYFVVCVLLLCCSVLHASIDAYEFKNDEQRHLYQKLTEELRCPKCQNQNLADSDSQIAADLRKELYQQLLAGKSENEIIDFMRERYGDFVLYKPRMQWNTVFLWAAPVVLILMVVLLLWLSRRQASTPISPSSSNIDADKSEYTIFVSRWIHVLSLLVLISVAAGSLLIYQHLGSARALQITELGQAVFSQQFADQEQARQQTILLDELNAWLADHPNDDGFVYMRARLLSLMGNWDAAIADYQNLVAAFPEQDKFLSEYAQTLFLKNNRELTEESRALLQRALVANPHNVTALGLLGMAAFEQKDYARAVDLWQRLLVSIPQGTPQASAIAEGVAKARALGGISTAAASSDDIKLRVQVSVAPEANAKPDDVAFVLLRAQEGSRMPLAVVKTTVAALAKPVTLDTATSPMKGQMDWSTINTFEVVVRLSHSGQPMPAAGDWEGISEPLQKNALPAELHVTVEHQNAQ